MSKESGFLQQFNMVIKKRKIFSDFESVEKCSKKLMRKQFYYFVLKFLARTYSIFA
jgi:hypothetical protein